MRTIHVSCPAPAAAEAVIDALWSGAEWQAAWSGITGFDVDYDDGEHQAARLHVDWDGEPRTLSLVRFRESANAIAFFCPEAPVPLSAQRGRWVAEPASGGSIVTAVRELDIVALPGESEAARAARLETYVARLQYRLGLILESFAARLEAAA